MSAKDKLTLMLIKGREIFVGYKVKIQRVMSWIAVINSGMIIFIFITALKDYGIEIDFGKHIILIYGSFVAVLLLLGFLDDKLGIHKEESNYIVYRNPPILDIIKRLERIEEKINKK